MAIPDHDDLRDDTQAPNVELSDLDAISDATGGISGTTTDLNEVARIRMEGPFGADFGGVNTHTDSAPSGG